MPSPSRAPAPTANADKPIEPSALRIVHYPAKVLQTRARVVPPANDHTAAVAKRMIELMFEAEGVGLAAPQVGLDWRMFIVHVPSLPESKADKDHPARSPDHTPPTATHEPMVFIDPVLSALEGAPEPYEEGCLSLPEIIGDVLRPPRVTISATNLRGERFTMTGGGLLARCWQHEFDHLEGVLILSRMSQMSRLRNRGAIKDLERGA